MKCILLFGAGKSATVLIRYLLDQAEKEDWKLVAADVNLASVLAKVPPSRHSLAVSFDTRNADERRKHIQAADLVISLLPPVLHILVAKDCIDCKKNLLTASYIDDEMRALKNSIGQNNILFLCEMGLDPGIDHMSAMQVIHSIKEKGGHITSFLSHCGGLVAPESDDNPWHYKISWNPKNVVMAGKAGALFKKANDIKTVSYEALFAEQSYVHIPSLGPLCWYPNRDSLSYMNTYGLVDCATFIRTTLRHPDFIHGWKNIVDLKLTGEEPVYNTNGKTLMQLFNEHLHRHGYSGWLHQKLQEQFDQSKNVVQNLVKLVELQEEAAAATDPVENFVIVTEEGALQDVNIEALKVSAARTVARTMRLANLTLKQLLYLGMDDDTTCVNKGLCSAADILQFAMEKKLSLQPQDKDMVVMMHEIGYEREGKSYQVSSSMILKGKDGQHTAMAATVGLPLGIAAQFILAGRIPLKGLHIPTAPEIYEPVLNELKKYNIDFTEETKLV